jgi:hypothetical protein
MAKVFLFALLSPSGTSLHLVTKSETVASAHNSYHLIIFVLKNMHAIFGFRRAISRDFHSQSECKHERHHRLVTLPRCCWSTPGLIGLHSILSLSLSAKHVIE